MAEMSETGLVAFDVGAAKHAFASRFGDQCKTGTIESELGSIRRFLTDLRSRCTRLRVIMEATGVYYLDLALIAAEVGAEVMVINPKAAHHFAKASGSRNKTDAIDARLLLAYLERMAFRPWTAPSPAALALRQFGRHLTQIKEESVAAKNRLHAMESTQSSPRILLNDLKRAITAMERRVERLSKEALRIVRADPELSARFDALDSIVGVADTAALSLLGELIVLPPDMNSRACTSHAGLDVRIHQSGTSVEKAPRLTKHGNKYLRRALFMPACTAIVHDPHARAFRDRLLGRGKKKIQAVVAVMRKLLTAAWALMRRPAVYDGSKLFAAGA